MLHQMVQEFNSAFYFQGTNWILVIIAVVVAIADGILWLALYRSPLFKKSGLWVVGVVSALLMWSANSFVQYPLTIKIMNTSINFIDETKFEYLKNLGYVQMMLVLQIPTMLLSGFLQEAEKMMPVLFYWLRNKKAFTPQLGLIAGAISGAGFGIFEAAYYQNRALIGLYPMWLIGSSSPVWEFLERFAIVGWHIAASALIGYGLATRRWWQFFVIIAIVHSFIDYLMILNYEHIVTTVQQETYMAGITVLFVALALWLRWHKPKGIASTNTSDIIADVTPQTPVS